MALFDDPREFRATEGAYEALLRDLYGIARRGMVLGTERMERVVRCLGHPERSGRFVHVAGSNGKGSTAAFLTSLLAAGGRRVGLYSSPHLERLTERVQWAGAGARREATTEELLSACGAVAQSPEYEALTFFEVMTAAALWLFARWAVEDVVVEAGLGARLDATRVVDPAVTVLTDISLEHENILGPGLDAVAREEAAVLRPGRVGVCANADATVDRVVDDMARTVGAPLLRLGRDFGILNEDGPRGFWLSGGRRVRVPALGLAGRHQWRNAALAVQAAVQLCPELSDAAIASALSSTFWPGRLERCRVRGVEVHLDGAQNAHAAATLGTALAEMPSPGGRTLIFGVLEDKDAKRMLEALAPGADRFIFCAPSSPRARPPRDLPALLPADFSGEVRVVDDVASALSEALRWGARTGGDVVGCGSLYLVGALRALIAEATQLE